MTMWNTKQEHQYLYFSCDKDLCGLKKIQNIFVEQHVNNVCTINSHLTNRYICFFQEERTVYTEGGGMQTSRCESSRVIDRLTLYAAVNPSDQTGSDEAEGWSDEHVCTQYNLWCQVSTLNKGWRGNSRASVKQLDQLCRRCSRKCCWPFLS